MVLTPYMRTSVESGEGTASVESSLRDETHCLLIMPLEGAATTLEIEETAKTRKIRENLMMRVGWLYKSGDIELDFGEKEK